MIASYYAKIKQPDWKETTCEANQKQYCKWLLHMTKTLRSNCLSIHKIILYSKNLWQ